MALKLYFTVVLVVLWFAGFYLRMPVLITAPVGPDIAKEFGLGPTALGMLTTAPVLLLGIGSLISAPVIGRLGARNTLFYALLLAAICSALRGASPNNTLLLMATFAMGLGIAAMQTALPAIIPQWCPRFIAFGSSVYLNGMMMGEFSGAGLTLPVLYPLVDGNWRSALIVASIPAFFVATAIFYPRPLGQPRAKLSLKNSLPRINDKTMWLFGLMVGTTAATFFAVNAYMAPLLRAKNMPGVLNNALMIFNISQLLASILMMVAAKRILALPRLLFITASLITLSLIGFVYLPGSIGLFFAVILGFSSAWQLIVLVALPPLMRGSNQAAQLAAGMFTVGYLLAFLLPVGTGMLTTWLGSIHYGLWLIILFNIVCLPPCWYIQTR